MGTAKPFLKWAGGKGQLLEQFKTYFPQELNSKEHSLAFGTSNSKNIIENYYEPFLGSGAVFFWVMQNYIVKKAYINELNPEIYLCFVTIQKNVDEVIKELKKYENKYHKLEPDAQMDFFYKTRDKYNVSRTLVNFKKYDAIKSVKRVAMTIFLNRTCFNGLYRVNSKGNFNVPFGKYNNPKICDRDNLLAVSDVLKGVVITNDDYSIIEKHIKPNSFVYLDPPYRPLNKTSSFTSYSSNVFDDKEQNRLASFVRDLTKNKQVKIMLSNSDPKNEDANDDFFDKLYSNFNLKRLDAKRMINCNSSKRGKIKELLIMNY